MKSQRKKQIMTLSILVVAVLVISIGFAAFSATLRINSSATVNPDAGTFMVKFSTTKDTLTVADVEPSSVTEGITATNGVIDNSASPTISNLSAEFKNPGDTVVYTFYARNEGEYQAYLNNVNFNGSKSCTAVEGEGATDTLVQAACNGISMTVSVAGTSYTSTTPITGHTLAKNAGEEIKVTLKYASAAAVADGPFTVSLPEITMVYSTVDDSTQSPSTGSGVCTLTDVDSSNDASKSDVVTCGTESFYVVENVSGNINMLSKDYITLSTTNPIQDTSGTAHGIDFSSSAYWWDETNSEYTVNSNYATQGREYPYVYNSNSNLYPYIEAYRDVLEGMGVNVKDAKLMSYEQAIALGCTYAGSFGTCYDAPSWLMLEGVYWLGSASSSKVWDIQFDAVIYNGNSFDQGVCDSDSCSIGIRPLITISASDLG